MMIISQNSYKIVYKNTYVNIVNKARAETHRNVVMLLGNLKHRLLRTAVQFLANTS